MLCMKTQIATSICIALLLSDCALQVPLAGIPPTPVQQPPAPPPALALDLAWARNDGQLISANPALTAQARNDVADCRAEIPPVRTSQGIAGADCMSSRGYHVREVPLPSIGTTTR